MDDIKEQNKERKLNDFPFIEMTINERFAFINVMKISK
jgi:hypothetical protein